MWWDIINLPAIIVGVLNFCFSVIYCCCCNYYFKQFTIKIDSTCNRQVNASALDGLDRVKYAHPAQFMVAQNHIDSIRGCVCACVCVCVWQRPNEQGNVAKGGPKQQHVFILRTFFRITLSVQQHTIFIALSPFRFDCNWSRTFGLWSISQNFKSWVY